MRVFLLFQDRDFAPSGKCSPLVDDLVKDLELEVLLRAMACGDEHLFKVAKEVLLAGLDDPETILYRQDILRDCLKHAPLVRKMYDISIQAIEAKRKASFAGIFSRYPSSILAGAVRVLQPLVDMLEDLRHIADAHIHEFVSQGFVRFFTMLQSELPDTYLAAVRECLHDLEFTKGVLISAELQHGCMGSNYTLRKLPAKKGWLSRMWQKRSPAYSFSVDPRDESGARALSELKDRGVNSAANALAQSVDHVVHFFETLHQELAFYLGCLNLYEQLSALGEPVCFPLPLPPQERKHSARELYDPCLALTMQRKVVGNDLFADGKDLVIITGANQGGKSTFLRSIGIAQLMMQCGMFVPAAAFQANVCQGIFTHFRRKEDATMRSGKLDEELKRMSDIVDAIEPDSLLLCNESFESTNEREGSEIARNILDAFLERRIKVFFVTHQYELAHGFYVQHNNAIHFLRAERKSNGERTFKVVEGEPLRTSYGEDLYRKIFKDTDTHASRVEGVPCEQVVRTVP